MTRRDEEQDQWDDDALVRALRAPGTPAELADQARFVAAYRAQRSSGSLGRLVGRFGIGATTVVTTIALSGGVAAAAYTSSLPDPVQRFAHDVLGPVGVPPVAPKPPVAKAPATSPSAPATPDTPSREEPTPQVSLAPGTPAASPTPTPSVVVVPGSPPSSDPAPSPSPSPGATPSPRRTPGALSATASDSKVPFGSAITVSGVLSDTEGLPLGNRVVRLGGRVSGQPWTRFAVGRTDREGRIVLQTPALAENTNLRLTTRENLRSSVSRVVVVPVVHASSTAENGSTTILFTTQGAQPEDVVKAYRRQGDRLVEIGAVTLDENGSATFSVPTPKRSVRIVLRLPSTRQHGWAQTALSIGQVPQRFEADPPDAALEKTG